MASTVAGRGKRVRDRQRAVHIVLGLVLVMAVYVPAESGSVLRAAVQWFVAPAAVVAGGVMWQWPALRRLRRRSASAQAPGRPAGVGDNGA